MKEPKTSLLSNDVWAAKLLDMKPAACNGGHGGSFVIIVRAETLKIGQL